MHSYAEFIEMKRTSFNANAELRIRLVVVLSSVREELTLINPALPYGNIHFFSFSDPF